MMNGNTKKLLKTFKAQKEKIPKTFNFKKYSVLFYSEIFDILIKTIDD